jgi:O-antigen ligase
VSELLGHPIDAAEQDTTPSSTSSSAPPRRRAPAQALSRLANSAALATALTILGIIALGGFGVVIAILFGRRIVAEQWPLLVTATALATYIAVSVANARHGLLFWIVTAPFARFAYLNLDMGGGIPNLTLNRIMTGVLLVLVLAQFAVRSRRIPRLMVGDFLVLAFVGASALSVPQAIVGLKSAAQSFFDLLVIPAMLYVLARCLITSREDLRSVMIALTIVGFYFSVLAIREQITGDVWFYPEARSVQYTASIRRVVALLGNPAYIAVTISMAIPWAWYLLLTARRHRLALLAIVLTMMAGVFFCMNRSGWVGLILSLLIMALLVPRFRPYFVGMLILAVMAVASYWAVIATSAAVRERLQAQGPIDYRRETWAIALRMIRDNPFFGIGYENFPHIYSQYGVWDVYLRATPTPHNTFFWVVLMGGLVALIPYVLMLATMFFSALGVYLRGYLDAAKTDEQEPISRQTGADLAAVFIASMAAVLAPSLVMDIFQGYYNTMIMFLIMGAFFGVVTGERRVRGGMSLWQKVHAMFVGQMA